MPSYAVNRSIQKKAQKENIKINRNIKTVLGKHSKYPQLDKKIVLFSWAMDMGSNKLNASASIPGLIVINAAWAAQLVMYSDIETERAYLITIGHEIMHQTKEFRYFTPFKSEIKFISWINEVRANYGAASIMFSGNRSILLNALYYKLNANGECGDTLLHPSWEKRIKYTREYNFDKELICKIAIDSGCTNQKLINKICDYYKPIILI